MAQQFPHLSERHIRFIAEQKIFFVATAAAESRVNVSPKGIDSLRVLGNTRVVWLNVTGSGNETSAHVQLQPRMTIMFCAFEGPPQILRIYGTAKVIHTGDQQWDELIPLFNPLPGARQVFDLAIDLVQISCGMGVPYYSYTGEREMLSDWAIKKGGEGLRQYWEDRNQESIDGIPTQIVARSS
jgi:hypothetical protein